MFHFSCLVENVSTLDGVAVSPQIGTIGVFSDANPIVRHDGVTLASVTQRAPVDQVGIKVGDVILAINNHYLFTVADLKSRDQPFPTRHEDSGPVPSVFRRSMRQLW